MPRHCVVALTSQRLWICTFRGGLVATPKEVVVDVPLDQVTLVAAPSALSAEVRLVDGSTLTWNFLPKSAKAGRELLTHLQHHLSDRVR